MTVYFLRVVGAEGPVKIGCSTLPKQRLTTICGWSPVPLELVATIPGDRETERRLHGMFADTRMHGEWFGASAELTNLIDDILADRFDASSIPDCGPIRSKRVWTERELEVRRLRIRCTRAMPRYFRDWPAHIREAYSSLGGLDHDRAVEVIQAAIARKAA